MLYISNVGDWSGSTIALKNLLTQLVPMGVEPLVVCKFRGQFTVWLDEKGISVEIIDFDWSYIPPIYSIRDLLAHYWRIYKYFRKERKCITQLETVCFKFKPEIIHSNNGIIQIGFKVAKKLGINHIWHLREYQTLDFGMYPMPSMKIFKKMLKKSNCVAITKDIQRFFELGSRESIVIYDGVMPAGAARYNPNKEKYFLFVGRIEKSKGIDILLDVFIDFCKVNEEYNLKIAGEGMVDFMDLMRAKVINAGINQRVDFLGFRTDRYDLMYNATATIVPSRFEAFGFITVEAIMNGCPVIGNNVGGTAEIASNSPGNILLYEGKNDLLFKLEEIVKYNISEIECHINNLQLDAQNRYSVEKSADMIFSYYNSLFNQQTN